MSTDHTPAVIGRPRARIPAVVYAAATKAARELEDRIAAALPGEHAELLTLPLLAHPPPRTPEFLNWLNEALDFETACSEYWALSHARAYALIKAGLLPHGEPVAEGARRVMWRRIRLLRHSAALLAAAQAEREAREARAKKARVKLARAGKTTQPAEVIS